MKQLIQGLVGTVGGAGLVYWYVQVKNAHGAMCPMVPLLGCIAVCVGIVYLIRSIADYFHT